MPLALDDIAVSNLLTYGLYDIIERNRHELPWSLCAAIGHVESEHDPFVYNYYQTDEAGKKHLRRGRWDGQPDTLPDGTNGQPNAWAAGWLQIIRPYPRGLSLEQRFDAEAEAKVLFPEWLVFYRKAQAAALDGRDLYAAVYFGHNAGPMYLAQGLEHRRADTILSVINNSGITDINKAQADLDVALKVADLVPQYQALEDQLHVLAAADELLS